MSQIFYAFLFSYECLNWTFLPFAVDSRQVNQIKGPWYFLIVLKVIMPIRFSFPPLHSAIVSSWYIQVHYWTHFKSFQEYWIGLIWNFSCWNWFLHSNLTSLSPIKFSSLELKGSYSYRMIKASLLDALSHSCLIQQQFLPWFNGLLRYLRGESLWMAVLDCVLGDLKDSFCLFYCLLLWLKFTSGLLSCFYYYPTQESSFLDLKVSWSNFILVY